MLTSSLVRPIRTALLATVLFLPLPAQAQPAQRSWNAVDQALGRAGTTQPDGVRRYSFPRSDLKVQLPGAYDEWAAERLGRGDTNGAVKLVTIAEAKHPADADALEIHGTALLLKGDGMGAATQFMRAARLAPNWGRNHLKWVEALARLGKRAEAREQLRRAAELPLSASDRMELESKAD